MALYEYLCSACRNEFELMRPMSKADESAECPRCSSRAQRVMMSSGSRAVDLMQVPEVASGNNMPTGQAAAPVEMSWLTDYQPSGGNLWVIDDWGIASVLGYLRDKQEAEPTESRPYPAEMMSRKVVQADEYHHRVLDQQKMVSIEPEVAARPAKTADRPLPASERQSVISVRPWPEEMAVEPAEANKDYPDLASQPGVKARRDGATADRTRGTNPSSPLAEEPVADLTSSAILSKERTATDFPDHIVKASWRRQGGRCAGCGRWLIWSHIGRDGATGAWQPHRMIPADQGGRTTVANCVILCSGVANCHFNIGHGGIGWSHYAPLDDSALLFLFNGSTIVRDPTAPTRPKRSLLKEVLGIPQSRRTREHPAVD